MSALVHANRFGGVMGASNFASGYEGAQSTGVRDGFFTFPLSGRAELNRYTRVELLRKKRALEASLPVVGRVQSAVGRKAVGHGVFPTPRTADTDWNKENLKQFLNRASNPSVWSVDGSMDFFEQTRFLVESRFGDGEGFAIFSLASTGTLQVDVRDPVECCSDATDTDLGFVDGIQINASGRPLAYRFETGGSAYYGAATAKSQPDFSVVPANAVCHLRRVRRAKSLRAVTEFYAGINSLIDVLDLKALLVGTAKLHSVLAVNVKRNKGDAGKNGITGQLQKLVNADGSTSKVSENFSQAAAISYLAENEDLQLLTSSHPSPNMVEFIKLLAQDVVLGTDLPYSVVLGMMGMSGAPTRVELEDAQNFFDAEQDRVVWRFCNKAYILDTALRMNLGLIRRPRDPVWWNCAWRGPAKLTADAKYTAQAAVLLMKNGALTHVDYYTQRGEDAYEALEEEIAFQAYARRRCQEEGVPVEAILEPTPGAAPAGSGAPETPAPGSP